MAPAHSPQVRSPINRKLCLFWDLRGLARCFKTFWTASKSLWKQLTENRPRKFRHCERLSQGKLYLSAFFGVLLCKAVFRFRSVRPKNSAIDPNFPKYAGLAKIPQRLWRGIFILSVRVQWFLFLDCLHNRKAQGSAIRHA